MALVLTTQASSNGAAATTSSLQVIIPAGSLVVVGVVGSPQTSDVTGITDDAVGGSNSYGAATSAKGSTNSTNDLFSNIWYCSNSKAAWTITVTVTAASTIGAIFVWVFANAGAGALDVASAVAHDTAAATLAGPAITTAQADEVICAICAYTDGVASASGTYASSCVVVANGHSGAFSIKTGTVSSEVCTWTDVGTGAGACSSAAFKSVLITIEQEGFLFRNDDNNEASATGIAAQDAGITNKPVNTNVRLRALLNSTNDTPSKAYQLEYRKVGGTAWHKIHA